MGFLLVLVSGLVGIRLHASGGTGNPPRSAGGSGRRGPLPGQAAGRDRQSPAASDSIDFCNPSGVGFNELPKQPEGNSCGAKSVFVCVLL